MNLHEECLLKYLINPLELFYTTEMLKNSNMLLEKDFADLTDIAKYEDVDYTKV